MNCIWIPSSYYWDLVGFILPLSSLTFILIFPPTFWTCWYMASKHFECTFRQPQVQTLYFLDKDLKGFQDQYFHRVPQHLCWRESIIPLVFTRFGFHGGLAFHPQRIFAPMRFGFSFAQENLRIGREGCPLCYRLAVEKESSTRSWASMLYGLSKCFAFLIAKSLQLRGCIDRQAIRLQYHSNRFASSGNRQRISGGAR